MSENSNPEDKRIAADILIAALDKNYFVVSRSDLDDTEEAKAIMNQVEEAYKSILKFVSES